MPSLSSQAASQSECKDFIVLKAASGQCEREGKVRVEMFWIILEPQGRGWKTEDWMTFWWPGVITRVQYSAGNPSRTSLNHHLPCLHPDYWQDHNIRPPHTHLHNTPSFQTSIPPHTTHPSSMAKTTKHGIYILYPAIRNNMGFVAWTLK